MKTIKLEGGKNLHKTQLDRSVLSQIVPGKYRLLKIKFSCSTILDCRGGTTYGKKCSYNCDKSTVEVGPGTDRSVTCEEDGLWSAANVFCQKTCRKPQVPLNARSLSKSCHNEMKVIAGLSCKYRCKNGYMAGGFTRTDLFKKTCMKDGTWSGPRCLPVRCPVSSQEVFRWYNCSFGNTFGSVCRLTCPVEKVRD